MLAIRQIEKISFEDNNIILQIDDNVITLNLEKLSSKLFHATEIEREMYKISPSGYGIHWPLIDEDLSIQALLNNYI